MDFPIIDLMDEDACYAELVRWLHPDGLACPRCHRADRMRVHRSHRAPACDYRCGHCHRVFNAFTGTILHGTRRRPRELVLIVRGFAQGVPTARLARELDCDRAELLKLRHRLQGAADRNRDIMPLEDRVLEADETYQNAGEKRGAASRSRSPTAAPGQRAARARHLGERSSTGLRDGRAGERSDPADGHRAVRR
jgi:transposase-like protein